MLTETQRTLALALLRVSAVKFGAFRLKMHEKNPDAPLSPIYIDLRLVRSCPKAMGVAADVYRELASGLRFDLYADVPTAATPLVAVLSFLSGVPMISPRLDRKSHGTGAPIDGTFEHGQVALLVDDLITRADSKLEAIGVLEAAGLVVRDVMVLVDRQQGGADELQRRGYTLHAALQMQSLLSFYRDEGRISAEDYARTIQYFRGQG
jgi:uridine monophosphate synthetase